MIYSDFQGKQLSMLGFGTMRLPTDSEGRIAVSYTHLGAEQSSGRSLPYGPGAATSRGIRKISG